MPTHILQSPQIHPTPFSLFLGFLTSVKRGLQGDEGGVLEVWVAAVEVAASCLRAEGQRLLLPAWRLRAFLQRHGNMGVGGGHRLELGKVPVTYTSDFALPCPSQTYSTPTRLRKWDGMSAGHQGEVGGGACGR